MQLSPTTYKPMKMTRTVYSCTYTRNTDEPHYSRSFLTEQAARDEAKKAGSFG